MSLFQYLDGLYEQFTQMPHHPAYLMLGLVLTSFLLEDLALAAGVSLSTAGSLLWSESFLAVWFGIVLGDLLLYAAGFYSSKIAFLKRHFVDKLPSNTKLATKRNLASVIFIARVTPGLRLVIYVYLGLKQLEFFHFLMLVTLACLIWTASLYMGSLYLGSLIANTLHIPQALGVALPLLLLALVTALSPWLRSQWVRCHV